jgi:hypothetical protein
MKDLSRLQETTVSVPILCVRDNSRDVVPLSTAVYRANRRYQVAPRGCSWGSIGGTDNDWFPYLTLQNRDWPEVQGARLKAQRSSKLIAESAKPKGVKRRKGSKQQILLGEKWLLIQEL